MWDEYVKWKRENPQAQEAALRLRLIGSPETIRKKLRRFRTSHIDQVILLNQAGKNSHEHICRSLELFGREVMPKFRHDHEHDAWKAAVMDGSIGSRRSKPRPLPIAMASWRSISGPQSRRPRRRNSRDIRAGTGPPPED